MIVKAALRDAAQQLEKTSETARLDAELLMAHTLGVSRSDMLLRHQDGEAPAAYPELVERRAGHEPVAYITGHQEFYGLDLLVTPDVLIPRGDSETLVEAARDALKDRPPQRILDLGTGSGALLLAGLSVWEQAKGVGIDTSLAALAVAAANAARLGVAERSHWQHADWHEPDWQAGLGTFDLILCNPPYVEEDAELAPNVRDFEPGRALFAGSEGLDDYKILVPQLPGLLNSGGIAVLEIGATQAAAVCVLAQSAGFTTKICSDLGNHPRALVLSRI